MKLTLTLNLGDCVRVGKMVASAAKTARQQHEDRYYRQ